MADPRIVSLTTEINVSVVLHNSEPKRFDPSPTSPNSHHTSKNFVLGAGFEPAEPFRATVLQTVAIVHSAIPALRRFLLRINPSLKFTLS